MQKKTVLILGVGNILLSDEGVGVHVVRRLSLQNLPPEVEVIDGGTVGYELITFFRDRKKVVIVDCLKADEPPGTMIMATPQELNLLWRLPLSAHQSGLRELLQQANFLTPPPEIIILVIVPENTDEPSMRLSKTLESRLDKIVATVAEMTYSELHATT